MATIWEGPWVVAERHRRRHQDAPFTEETANLLERLGVNVTGETSPAEEGGGFRHRDSAAARSGSQIDDRVCIGDAKSFWA
ncbi:MAG: hypothetical protein R3D56_00675 [Paracoccaceae bacterium]